MAGDKKGKGKVVAQKKKKKKRTREDREREQAEAVADDANRQGSLRIRDPQTQGSHSSSYVAQDVLRQLRPHLSPTHVHGLEVVALRGEQAMHSSTPTVRLRQVVRTVMRSCPRLSCLISGAYQDLESRD